MRRGCGGERDGGLGGGTAALVGRVGSFKPCVLPAVSGVRNRNAGSKT